MLTPISRTDLSLSLPLPSHQPTMVTPPNSQVPPRSLLLLKLPQPSRRSLSRELLRTTKPLKMLSPSSPIPIRSQLLRTRTALVKPVLSSTVLVPLLQHHQTFDDNFWCSADGKSYLHLIDLCLSHSKVLLYSRSTLLHVIFILARKLISKY